MPGLTVNGTELNYTISGQGPALLFLHGLGSSTRDWEEQVPFFSKDYTVICFDVRGHGASGKPPGPYSVKLFAEDTAAFITALDLASVHIVGLSMGGMIAFQLAVDHPGLVKSMSIVNSGPQMVARSLKERLQIFQRSVLFRLFSMRKIGQIIAGRLFPEPHQEALRTAMIDRWARNDKRAYMAAFQALVGWSVDARIDAIRCPTLVIAADQDYTPVSDKKAYVARMPNAQLVVIADSRHATPLDQPDRFNEVLADFLSTVA